MTAVEALSPPQRALTARDVLRALWGHYTPRYAVLTEFVTRGEPTLSARGYMERPERRIDALLVSKTERIGIEVKVTRADFLADVRRPEKQEPWQRLTHRFAYAVPAGLVRPDEIPAGCGLIEVEGYTPSGQYVPIRWTIRAPKKPAGAVTEHLPTRMVWAATIRLAAAEARLKGYYPGDHSSEDPDDLKARIVDLTRMLNESEGRADRADKRAAQWQRVAAAWGPLTCRRCGQPIRHDRYDTWKHATAAADAPCLMIREALRDAAKAKAGQDTWAGRYYPTPPIEPEDPA